MILFCTLRKLNMGVLQWWRTGRGCNPRALTGWVGSNPSTPTTKYRCECSKVGERASKACWVGSIPIAPANPFVFMLPKLKWNSTWLRTKWLWVQIPSGVLVGMMFRFICTFRIMVLYLASNQRISVQFREGAQYEPLEYGYHWQKKHRIQQFARSIFRHLGISAEVSNNRLYFSLVETPSYKREVAGSRPARRTSSVV